MLPFVLLGIGIDDTFVLMQGLALYPPCTKVKVRVTVRVRLRLRLRLRLRVRLRVRVRVQASSSSSCPGLSFASRMSACTGLLGLGVALGVELELG